MSGPNDMQTARAEPVRLTWDDLLRLPEDGLRHELIDGEHYVTAAPNLRHQDVLRQLLFPLGNHLDAHPIGKIYFAPADVVLSDYDVVEPDLLFVSNERREILGDRVNGAPDLAVEILSPSTRRMDEQKKRDLYHRFGVREYWVVDPELETVKIYRRQADGKSPRVAELSRETDDRLESPMVPGFSLALAEL